MHVWTRHRVVVICLRKPWDLVLRAPVPKLAHWTRCPQVYAYGSCFDGDYCTDAFWCNDLAGSVTPAMAATDIQYSRADAWFPPGTHTVLLRLEVPIGCGGTLNSSLCVAAAHMAFQILQGSLMRPCWLGRPWSVDVLLTTKMNVCGRSCEVG